MPIYARKTLETRNPPAGKKPAQKTIWVPAWNDVIHIADERQLPRDEQLKRIRQRIIRLKQSPTPAIVNNIGIILTALDDIQDFTTTAGVATRIVGRVFKPAALVAKGAFTSGALINSIQLHNKIPLEKLSPSRIKALLKEDKLGFEKLSAKQLRELERIAERTHPKWEKISIDDKKEFLRKNYKMTRERWGLPLKVKKRMAEDLYSKGTPWGKIKVEVDRRLKRLLPTHGETLEIAQTSDQLANIGISFGPLVGFVTDLMFGIGTGAKFKFTDNTPSSAEKKVLIDAMSEMTATAKNPLRLIERASEIVYKGTIAWASLPEDAYLEFLNVAWGVAQAQVITRGPELWKAIKNIGAEVWKYQWNPGPRTPEIIKDALLAEGISPERRESWPGIELTEVSLINEISTKFLSRIPAQTKMFQAKLDGTIEGEFLTACLDTIAFNTAMAISEEGSPIKETFAPELSIYTRAIDYGLEPPLWADENEFKAWHNYVLDYVEYFDQDGPPYDLLERAYQNFFPEETKPE